MGHEQPIGGTAAQAPGLDVGEVPNVAGTDEDAADSTGDRQSPSERCTLLAPGPDVDLVSHH
jgi:hypothetical protein